MADNIDVSEDILKGTGNVTLVLEQARKMFLLDREIAQIKGTLKLKEEEYRKLSCETLPGLMESEGVPSPLGLASGYTLVVEPAFRCNLPAESTIEKADEDERPALEKRRIDGLQWLRSNKASAIIKTEIKTKLGAGQEMLAKAVMASLRSFSWKGKKVKLDLEQKEAVHPGTLSKLLKEKRDHGIDIPLATFAVFDGKEAKIKPPKKGKENQ